MIPSRHIGITVTLLLLASFGIAHTVAFASGNGTAGMVNGVVDGTIPPGGSCTQDANCEDVGSQSYGCYPEGGGVCTPDGDAVTSAAASTGTGSSAAAPTGSGSSAAASTGSGSSAAAPSGTSVTTLQNPLNASDLQSLLNEILGYVVLLGSIALVIMLVYVGFLFVAARGNAEKVSQARQALLWTVIGGLLLLGAQGLATVISSTVQTL